MTCTIKLTSASATLPGGRPSPDWPATQTLAREQLRATGVRVTAARVKVLGTLLAAPRALSHQEIQQHFTDMDRVTLYRALDTLTEASLAHKIAGDDRVFRYSAGAEHANPDSSKTATDSLHSHGHFKCARCAKVFCLDDSTHAGLLAGEVLATASHPSLQEQLQAILQQSLGPGFRSQDIELTIKGLCPDCST